MRPGYRKAALLLGIILMFSFAGFAAFINAGKWLTSSDRPVYSRGIVILSGQPSRALYAADLYRSGFSRDIYITRPIREQGLKVLDDLGISVPRAEDIYREILVKKGVPPESIHFLGNSCLSTIDEADAINRTFKGDGCIVLIVTSPYHIKRARMVFKDRMSHCGFRMMATPYETYPGKWWTDQDSARNVLLEYIKIIYYRLGGSFRSGGQVGEENI